jgi:hypothetical protein
LFEYGEWDHVCSQEEEEEGRERQDKERLVIDPKERMLGEQDQAAARAAANSRALVALAAKGFAMAPPPAQDPPLHRCSLNDPDGTEHIHMGDIDALNEHVLRDAKQQGRQANVTFNASGKMRIQADEELGSRTGRYSWGQNGTEVFIKCTVAKDVKSRQVQLSTTSKSVRLVVQGKVVCEGPTHQPILSDESKFVIEDGPHESTGRLLTMTLRKRDDSSANQLLEVRHQG